MASYSIIIPIYNIEEKYLRQCIESVTEQKNGNLEILLIDDGSERYVGEVCREYERDDERVRYIRQDNCGVSVARNTGIDAATKDYVIFLDADDWIPFNFINEIDSEITGNNSDVILYDYLSEYKNREIKRSLQNNAKGHLNNKDLVFSVLRFPNLFAPYDVATIWSKLIRRDFLVDSELRFTVGIKKGQDTLFALSLYQECDGISYVPIGGYCYRKSESSVTHKFNKDIVEIKEALYSEYSHFLNKYGYGDLEKEILSRFRAKVLLGDYMNLYYCHKDNPKTARELKSELADLINDERYEDVLHCGGYGVVQKIEYWLLKNGKFDILKFVWHAGGRIRNLVAKNYD